VHQAAEAIIQRSDTAKGRLSTRIIRPLKDMVHAKKDEEEIQQLQEKITNMFAEFQVSSDQDMTAHFD
jgi:CRISPR/Cas system-associated protein Csm6